ncbi:MAG TPA: 50S ribosomal protein L4 [Ignavibacteria bacterium]|nr:50S ribosomal protein L4 [Ignavibacteria bacterium]
MKVDVYKIDGSKSSSKVELSDDIFGIEPNDHVIYLAVKAFLANQRQGTHKAKERAEVRGGGRKPWKQKGRGGARAGTTRSPLWVGGGTIFGPRPRNYRQKLNKKVLQLARKSALSYKAKADQIIVVEDFDFDSPKTKELLNILSALKINGKKTLLLTAGNRQKVYLSGRNLPKLSILEASNASTYDLVNNQLLLLQKSAVEEIQNSLN